MTDKYICMDIETGGIGNDKSLLTAFFMVLDENLQPSPVWNGVPETLSLAIRPKDKIYKVTAEALGINGINLVEHDKNAITQDQAGMALFHFIHTHSDGGKNKLIPLGHNVAFDIRFLSDCNDRILTRDTWNQFVSYRCLDTATIAQFLRLNGKLPMTLEASLGKLASYFGIDTTGAHTAQRDVEITIAVYKKLSEIIK